jgi:signal transduction histidine kinase
MKLKYQLLLLALLSLLFPFAGWLALKSVDKEFRLSIENASKNTLMSLKASIQQQIKFNQNFKLKGLSVQQIDEINLNGDDAEWSDLISYSFNRQQLQLNLKIATVHNQLALLIKSNDSTKNTDPFDQNKNDFVTIGLANDHGLQQLKIKRQAEGFTIQDGAINTRPEYKAYWHEVSDGYVLEILFEKNDYHHLGVASVDVASIPNLNVGTLQNGSNSILKLENLVSQNPELSEFINNITPENNQFSLIDQQGRTIYQADKLPDSQKVSNWQWIITPLYHWLFTIDNTSQSDNWFYRQDDGMAGIVYSITEDDITYSLKSMMPQGQQNMIQTLLKASIMMIAVVLLIMLAYLLYSLILAWRIKKLNRSLQTVLDDSGSFNTQMPSNRAKDEIGQLSRGIESMLGEMAEYTQYLKELGSRLSHEMKTPLAIVQSSLDNLEMENDPEFLQRAKQGTSRLKFILNQLSELSQLKYTLEQTPKEAFNLTELVQNLGRSYLSFTDSLKLDICEEAIIINGSAELIAQMIDKLLDNAMDFTPLDGEIILSLKQSDTQASLSVYNSGSQLPKDTKVNIFDSLVSHRNKSQKDFSNKEAHLGLGLHLVRLIARYHAAKVSAINIEEPLGVQFSITF